MNSIESNFSLCLKEEIATTGDQINQLLYFSQVKHLCLSQESELVARKVKQGTFYKTDSLFDDAGISHQ